MLNTELMLYLDKQLDYLTMGFDSDGINLFNNNMPDEPDTAVMVEDTGGGPQNMRMPYLRNPTIRILVRGEGNPVHPRQISMDIIDLIGTYHDAFFTTADEVWSSTTNYSPKMVVEHEEIFYVARQESTDVEPGVDTDWEDYWIELDGHFVTRCQRQNGPAPTGRDQKNRIRFSSNFELRTLICNTG